MDSEPLFSNPVKRKVALFGAGTLVAAVSVFIVFGDLLNDYLLKGKMFHTTSGTVYKVERTDLSSSEVMIYFLVDAFDGLDETNAKHHAELEASRLERSDYRKAVVLSSDAVGLRFGSRIVLTYRATQEGQIEIANISTRESD